MTVAALLLTDLCEGIEPSAEAVALRARHDRLARDLLRLHGGREIDKTDGFLLLFADARDAIAYAVAYHRAVRGIGLAARAGLHVGDVILTENPPADVARGAKPVEVDGIAKPTAARVMSVAMAGQTLVTRDARDALGDTAFRVVPHGHWRMKGVAEPVELFEVGDDSAPMKPPPDGAKVYRVVHRDGAWTPAREVRHHVPADRDPFVGRVAELRALADLVDGARVAAVTGGAGSGKTRLVLHYARTWLGGWPGGAWFCDVSAARSVADVCGAMAAVLDVPLGVDDPVERIGEAVAERGECLVVLDGVDEASPSALAAVGRWRDVAREARFVVTAREAPGIADAALALGPLVADDAFELFVLRARQVRPEFVPDDEASIRSLVALLDHLPSEIERAATRVSVMPPAALLRRLSNRGAGVPVEAFEKEASSAGRIDRSPIAGSAGAAATVRALLLTDVVDSTRLSEQLGDAAMAALWARHDRVARDLLARHGGREIDKTDGFVLLFDRAGDAVGYAVAYHAALRDLGVSARAGIFVGDVVLTENAPADVAVGAKPLEVDGMARSSAAWVLAAAVGGQTLLPRAAREALGDTRLRVRSHGWFRRRGVAEPVELFEVGDDSAPMTPPPDGAALYRVVERDGVWLPVREVRRRLPEERDAFVGRERDLRALAERVAGARLVSVLAMGGSGKTRLVTRFAWSWLGDYPGGAWFRDLSEARSAEGICQAVATTLDVPLTGREDPVVLLGHAIAGRGECLVVLDNFEQVARHAAETLGKWLDRARDARFVVTTREVLGLPGETALPLAPLASDDSFDLFVVRARRADPAFVPSDVDAIRSLVEVLDHLPLAIELAAARVGTMSPRAMLERMSARLGLGSDGPGHTRQATLRATFDWSWELLHGDERAAMAQLSAFEGGFTLEAAEGVLALAERSPTDAVQALVERSWVRRGSDERFHLLASVQEYAAEKLLPAGPPLAVHERHGAWFARFGRREFRSSLRTHGGRARRRELGRDLGNLVSACRRAVERRDPAVAVPALLAAAGVLELTGPAELGLQLATGVEGLDLSEGDRVQVELSRSTPLADLGRSEEERASLERALSRSRALGDRLAEGRTLGNLAGHCARAGRFDEAAAHAERALSLAREGGDRSLEGNVLVGISVAHFQRGRFEESRAQLEAAVAIYRELGDAQRECHGLQLLGNGHLVAGRLEEARRCYEEALARGDEGSDPRTHAMVLSSLGIVHYEQGRSVEAKARWEAALAINRDIGNARSGGIVLGNLGFLNLHAGRWDEARHHFEQALVVHREQGFTYGQGHWLGGLARVAAATGSEEWRSLADEAVSVSAPYAGVHAEELAVRARLLLDHGEIEAARSDVDAARALGASGAVGAAVALADARTSHAEGRAEAAEAALAEADSLAEAAHVGSASPTGREIAEVAALVRGGVA